jgi:hypothetical protein
MSDNVKFKSKMSVLTTDRADMAAGLKTDYGIELKFDGN